MKAGDKYVCIKKVKKLNSKPFFEKGVVYNALNSFELKYEYGNEHGASKSWRKKNFVKLKSQTNGKTRGEIITLSYC